MTADEQTLAWYQAAAPRFTLSSAQAPSRHLDPFLDRLPAGAHILELGCGAGRDGARIVQRGFRLDPTDATPAMVAKARERFGLAARVLRFDELDAAGAYDAIWAHACLLHVARADLPDILARIHRSLVPGGWHFANFKLGDGDEPLEGRDPLGRLTGLPTEDWLRDVYAEAGFELVEGERYRGKGCDGVIRDWYALTVRK